MGTRCIPLIVALLLATGCSSSKPTARAPTHQEREDIVNVLPVGIRTIPAACVDVHIRVSQDSRYALAGFEFFNATKPPARCIRYARDGFFILKRTPAWRIVYDGSDPPRCAMKIPSELFAPLHCLKL